MNLGIYDLAKGPHNHLPDTFGAFGGKLLHVVDRKAANTAGGTFTHAGWRTRTLNTVLTNLIPEAQPDTTNNKIILPPATYIAMIRAPAYGVADHRARLRDTTTNTTLLIGSSSNSSTSAVGVTDSIIRGQFTIKRYTTIELQHYCSSTQATNGFGKPVNDGELEQYSDVMIWKIS